MFSITRDEFIEAALAETERLRLLVNSKIAGEYAGQEQVNRWMTRMANIQFAIEHLDARGGDGPAMLAPSEMRALMEILYG